MDFILRKKGAIVAIKIKNNAKKRTEGLDKFRQRFKRLDWYIGKHRPKLTSGLYDVDVFEERESLHEAKGEKWKIQYKMAPTTKRFGSVK